MKTLLPTSLAAVLIALSASAADDRSTDRTAIPVLAPAASPLSQELRLVQDQAQKKPAPAKPTEAAEVLTAEKELAALKKKAAELAKRIEADHVEWEKIEKQMDATKERIAVAQTVLENERAKLKAMEAVVAKIEKRHNKDHEDEEALKKTLAAKVKDLKEREGRMDEISKLEKRAAELRKEAEELRKKAEELKKN